MGETSRRASGRSPSRRSARLSRGGRGVAISSLHVLSARGRAVASRAGCVPAVLLVSGRPSGGRLSHCLTGTRIPASRIGGRSLGCLVSGTSRVGVSEAVRTTAVSTIAPIRIIYPAFFSRLPPAFGNSREYHRTKSFFRSLPSVAFSRMNRRTRRKNRRANGIANSLNRCAGRHSCSNRNGHIFPTLDDL